MKRNWIAKAALGIAVIALGLGVAFAQAGPGPGGRHGGHGPGMGAGMLGKMADELGLTTDQRAQIRQIRAKYMAGSLGTHRDAMREARANLRVVVHDPASTDEQIQAAADAVAAQIAPLAIEGRRMAAEISAVLTPEQRAKAAELRQQWQSRRRGGHALEKADEF